MFEYYLSEAIKYFSGSNTNAALYMTTAAPDMSCQLVTIAMHRHTLLLYGIVVIISIFVVSKINNL